MTWDPVPWMIDGGAVHSTRVTRNLAFFAANGIEGVVQSKGLEVRALGSPGASVQIHPGTCAIQSRDPLAIDEMYICRLPEIDTVGISPTGASARSDLIVARVENPNEGESWPAPTTIESGPYMFTRVISGVPSTTATANMLGQGHSMVALARIDIPANTSAITQAMIKDLRRLNKAQSKREFYVNPVPTPVSAPFSSAWSRWPQHNVAVFDSPEWATHCRGVITVNNFTFGGDGTNGSAGWEVIGYSRIMFGPDAGPVYGQANPFNMLTVGRDRGTIMAGATDVELPQNLRGVPIAVRLETMRNTSVSNADMVADQGTIVMIDVEFYSRVESVV